MIQASASPSIVGTSRPLVIKGTERIESIVVPADNDMRRESQLYTPLVSRILRRDFNVTSVKLFFFCKRSPSNHQLITHLLHRVTEEADVLANMAMPYELPRAEPFSVCTMRVITDEAFALFDALHTMDRSLFKLLNSPMGDLAFDNLTPFMRAYNTLRQKAFGYDVRRPAEQEPANDVK